jgi:hypothetical protein
MSGHSYYIVDEHERAIVAGPFTSRVAAHKDDAAKVPDTIIMSERAVDLARSDRPLRDERGDVDVVTDGGTVPGGEADRVMVDIETLGRAPGAAICSIGAVEFDERGLGEEFYREISLESCQARGLEIDAETLAWWLSQDAAVSGVLTGGESIRSVLFEFNHWYCAHEFDEVWANSPSFDCDLLEAAYEAAGVSPVPWEYHEQRDVRTLRSLPCAVEVEMEGDEHDALDDARYQARIVSETLQSLPGGAE